MVPEWLKAAVENGLIASERGVNAAALGAPVSSKLDDPGLSEAEFQAAVIAEAHLWKWRVAHFRKVCVQRADGRTYWETPVAADGKGFLDLELVKSPRLIKAELKVGRNKPTREQEEWKVAYAGIPGLEVYVWRPEDWQQIQTILRGTA